MTYYRRSLDLALSLTLFSSSVVVRCSVVGVKVYILHVSAPEVPPPTVTTRVIRQEKVDYFYTVTVYL